MVGTTLWRALVAALMATPALAQSSSSSASSASLSSSSSSLDTVSTAEELAQTWFSDNFDDNETQLAVGVNSALTAVPAADIVCSGMPSIQRRSVEAGPNGGCPDIFSALNASCSCLTDYADAAVTTWTFVVAKRASDYDSYPTTLNATDVLYIDAIRTLLVPSTLTTLRITGVGDEPQSISFVPQDEDLPGSTLPIAANAEDTDEETAITTVELVNLNMSSIAQSAATFLPSNTVNLTLRHCNLLKFGYNFMEGLDNVQNLDVSSNYLTAPYAGSSIQKTCSNQLCAVQTLNLTSNWLSTFPEIVFNLENLRELYIADNLITDFNISESLYQSIVALDAFTADAPDPTAICTGGDWKIAHNATFCVANTTSSTTDIVSSSGTKVWVYIVIAAAVIIVVLAAVLLYQRYVRSRKGSNFSKSFDSDIGDTFNFDDTLEHVDSVFLNDPVIITSRIEYKELKVGKCISQGGFGLVFAGEFHGRRVAIKKIRPDRSNDVAGIEQFLKEIILMAQLYHPRIVEFIGVAWDVLRHLSAVNEFMDHGDLRNVLHGYKLQSTPLTWRAHKARISLHIAEALSYLHSLKPKVIHRDLKSKNVLLNLHLDAKLSDFGISRQRFRVETHMTVGVGTSFWIAPEVLLGKDYDERADIFSFGVVLSEIDTDDYPYWNDANKGGEARGKLQEAEILSLVAAGQKRPEFTNDCPPGILDIADCCLQKDPKDRPSAAEIVVMLQHLIDEGVGLDGGSQAQAVDSPASSPSSAYVGWGPRLS